MRSSPGPDQGRPSRAVRGRPWARIAGEVLLDSEAIRSYSGLSVIYCMNAYLNNMALIRSSTAHPPYWTTCGRCRFPYLSAYSFSYWAHTPNFVVHNTVHYSSGLSSDRILFRHPFIQRPNQTCVRIR